MSDLEAETWAKVAAKLTVRNNRLISLIKDFLEWYDDENADECKLDEFIKLFREEIKQVCDTK